jgi:hypothetical protein
MRVGYTPSIWPKRDSMICAPDIPVFDRTAGERCKSMRTAIEQGDNLFAGAIKHDRFADECPCKRKAIGHLF